MVGAITYSRSFTVGGRVVTGLTTCFFAKHIDALAIIAFAPGFTEDLKAGVLGLHTLTVLTV
jgi:hypothetical protein